MAEMWHCCDRVNCKKIYIESIVTILDCKIVFKKSYERR